MLIAYGVERMTKLAIRVSPLFFRSRDTPIIVLS